MSFDLIALMIRTQWRDRIMTSSFLIGITLQTSLLSLAIVQKQAGENELLLLAVRASLFTGINILLFSAMSSLSNEFRYGTFEYTHLSAIGWNRVLLLRAMATSIISWPVVVGPFLAAMIASHGLGLLRMGAFAGGVFFLLWIICYWMTYLLNLSEQPMTILPLLKYVLLIFGLNLVHIPLLTNISYLIPTYWFLQLIEPGKMAVNGLGFLVTVATWTIVITIGARPLVDRKMTSSWLSGRNA